MAIDSRQLIEKILISISAIYIIAVVIILIIIGVNISNNSEPSPPVITLSLVGQNKPFKMALKSDEPESKITINPVPKPKPVSGEENIFSLMSSSDYLY